MITDKEKTLLAKANNQTKDLRRDKIVSFIKERKDGNDETAFLANIIEVLLDIAQTYHPDLTEEQKQRIAEFEEYSAFRKECKLKADEAIKQ